MKKLAMALSLVLAFTGTAEAKHRHHHHGRLPWCGIYMTQLTGIHKRSLWLAREWAKEGVNAGGPRIGAIVVWPHHVGKITGYRGGQWIVLSGNDGNAVRERPRSLHGAIAFRIVNSLGSYHQIGWHLFP
jgi:hypothetical protein